MKKKYYGHPKFYELIEQEKELHSRKNRDYSGDDPLSNLRMCQQMGLEPWKGVILRLTDKFSRIMQLSKRDGKHSVKDETIIDTLRDISVYAKLCIILIEEKEESQEEKSN